MINKRNMLYALIGHTKICFESLFLSVIYQFVHNLVFFETPEVSCFWGIFWVTSNGNISLSTIEKQKNTTYNMATVLEFLLLMFLIPSTAVGDTCNNIVLKFAQLLELVERQKQSMGKKTIVQSV